ncbi:hypothetical protein HMI56_003246, partial [Coelomomyces lativittatus]
ALELSKIRSHHWNIVPCSAFPQTPSVESENKLHSNLFHGLDWVVSGVASRIFIVS